MTPDSPEMCLMLRATLLRSYSKSRSVQPTGSSSMALGPHRLRARSSVIDAIASVWPIGPVHIGPEMRLSERSTGWESGRKQCIGSESSEVSGCRPDSIDEEISSAVGQATLHPSEHSTSLAPSTLRRTRTETLRW